jgi:oxygen-independent coproporphyrinogen-3 oxidase
MDNQRVEIFAEAEEAVRRYRRYRQLGMMPREKGDFWPAVFYPPLTMYPPATAETLYRGYKLADEGLVDVYAHIPFCIKDCTFCDIPIVTGAKESDKRFYVDMLEREMDLWMGLFGLSKIKTRSISFGGGTPTCMSPALLDHFFEMFFSRLDLEHCTQIAMDLDPATVVGPEGAERLAILRRWGLQRLCYGVQSLRDDVLKEMNRAHTAAEAREAIARSLEAGFKVNFELIVGYRTETLESWYDVMHEAVRLGADEIQIYRLKVLPYREETGAITGLFSRKKDTFPSVEDTLRMMRMAILMLRRHGYEEALRHFYARTPEDYSHYLKNQTTLLRDQVGFGHTAYTNLSDRFVYNSWDVDTYLAHLSAGRLAVERGLVRDEETQLRRAFSMPLRYWRVAPDDFRRITGRELCSVFAARVARLKAEGLLDDDRGGLRLTDWGSFFAHETAQLFHDPKYLRFPQGAYEDGPLNPYRDNVI